MQALRSHVLKVRSVATMSAVRALATPIRASSNRAGRFQLLLGQGLFVSASLDLSSSPTFYLISILTRFCLSTYQ